MAPTSPSHRAALAALLLTLATALWLLAVRFWPRLASATDHDGTPPPLPPALAACLVGAPLRDALRAGVLDLVGRGVLVARPIEDADGQRTDWALRRGTAAPDPAVDPPLLQALLPDGSESVLLSQWPDEQRKSLTYTAITEWHEQLPAALSPTLKYRYIWWPYLVAAANVALWFTGTDLAGLLIATGLGLGLLTALQPRLTPEGAAARAALRKYGEWLRENLEWAAAPDGRPAAALAHAAALGVRQLTKLPALATGWGEAGWFATLDHAWRTPERRFGPASDGKHGNHSRSYSGRNAETFWFYGGGFSGGDGGGGGGAS